MVDPSRPSRTNELTVLAEFILKHSANHFDKDLSYLINETGEQHDSWAAECPNGHLYDDVPCIEWEKSLSLGVSWLKSRIEEASRNAS